MSTRSDQEPVTALAVSIERGAAMVGVTPRHFRKQLDTEGGPIRTVRMGNRVLIPVDELRNYLKPAPTADEAEEKKRTRAGGQRGEVTLSEVRGQGRVDNKPACG